MRYRRDELLNINADPNEGRQAIPEKPKFDSLIDEAHAVIEKLESQLKESRMEVWADRALFTVIGLALGLIYAGFQYYQFRYLSTQLWNKLIAWCLT